MNYFFMSFRDTERNKNLGVCIVSAPDFDAAIKKALGLRINPGGEIMAVKMSETMFLEEGLESDRLYTKAELMELGYETIGNH